MSWRALPSPKTNVTSKLSTPAITENTDVNLNDYSQFPGLSCPRQYEINVSHFKNYIKA